MAKGDGPPKTNRPGYVPKKVIESEFSDEITED